MIWIGRLVAIPVISAIEGPLNVRNSHSPIGSDSPSAKDQFKDDDDSQTAVSVRSNCTPSVAEASIKEPGASGGQRHWKRARFAARSGIGSHAPPSSIHPPLELARPPVPVPVDAPPWLVEPPVVSVATSSPWTTDRQQPDIVRTRKATLNRAVSTARSEHPKGDLLPAHGPSVRGRTVVCTAQRVVVEGEDRARDGRAAGFRIDRDADRRRPPPPPPLRPVETGAPGCRRWLPRLPGAARAIVGARLGSGAGLASAVASAPSLLE